jgi:hypothetical protein
MAIDKKFWTGKQWDSHLAFDTIDHEHIACYYPAEGYDWCEVMAVGCRDGRWYVEDDWGMAHGAAGVWDPRAPEDIEPVFFESREAAIRHAVAVVAKICGVSEEKMLKVYLK